MIVSSQAQAWGQKAFFRSVDQIRTKYFARVLLEQGKTATGEHRFLMDENYKDFSYLFLNHDNSNETGKRNSSI